MVVTIGPSTKDRMTLERLIRGQMDIARLNFSWGTHEEHEGYIRGIRAVAEALSARVPIIQDLSGPRMQKEEGHEFDPHADVLTEKDLHDLDFGARHNVEYVALSYVGNARHIDRLREEMRIRKMNARVIAKVERSAALDRLNEIVAAADAVMIGRGDLGNEVPLERIPYIERDIIKAAKAARKPVITATQMMLSMVNNPEPTRAEVTDVTYAILLGSDAVMLSDETAQGKYPVEAVLMMERILLEAEKHAGGFAHYYL